jgi:uncharacterized protein YlxW (UPF0749 family)
MEKFKIILENTKEFVSKHWKVIVVCICALLLLGQCSSCNRDNRVERKEKELIELQTKCDSIQTAYNHLNDRFEDSQNHNNDFSSIAQGNQAVLINKVDSLTNVTNTQARTISTLQEDKRALQTLNNELSRRVEAFREENIKLNAQVVDLMSKLNK